jgi:hypothetical protein
MTSPRSRLAGAAALALAALLVTACSGTPDASEPLETATATTPAAPEPEPASTPKPQPASTDEPTCETIIGDDVVADFESLGWTSQAEPFYIASLELSDGLQCTWADFEGPAGDHGQMFGWAPISEDDAEDAQAELLGQGWIKEEGPEGIYITESPDTTITTDAEGYGMTYLFIDGGGVKLADTKQGLLLIEWPRS